MNSWCSVSKLCDVISIQNLFWKVQCIFLKIFKYISAISVFLFFLLHFLYLLLFFTMRLLVIVEELCLEMFYIYIYIYMCVCVCVCVWCLQKFPDFFVQTFEIVVDTWTFSILLLYILLDDWLIFMISGSNEQLLQQLEYILKKLNCHSWGISKMQSGHEDTLGEQYAIKFGFNLGKNATETHEILQSAFEASCINRESVFEWHKRFKKGRLSVRDDERCGRSKEVNTPDLIGQWVRVRVTMLRF